MICLKNYVTKIYVFFWGIGYESGAKKKKQER
jgi:hypothetical protein